ncbi:MAG TPA: hypothetical protein VKV33_03070 [Streptosporangiaceae bacterium]|nr:hypothetical protein [Streptosporangiaceae bacterium]
MGSLVRGGTGIITFAVTNTGKAIAKTVTAAVRLPSGVSYLAGGTLGADGMAAAAGPGGWSCRAGSAGARASVQCTHGPLGPGASATGYLNVVIAADAPLGTPPSVAADVGGFRVSARGETGVTGAGLPARYAAEGHEAVVSAGNAFPQCGWWADVIPGWCRHRSSLASVSLPGQVEWAGLYWSWVGSRPNTGLRLSGPGHGAQEISADDTGTDASLGEPVHQAFADVTDLVRQDGSGVWRAAIPDGGSGGEPSARKPGRVPSDGDSGWGQYGGWALVVVADDPAVPAGPVMVLDGTHVVAPGSAYSVPVDGLVAGRRAGILEATWRGRDGGPAFGTLRQVMPSPARATLAAGAQPYLVGVVAVSGYPDGILPPGHAVPPGRVLPPRPGSSASPSPDPAASQSADPPRQRVSARAHRARRGRAPRPRGRAGRRDKVTGPDAGAGNDRGRGQRSAAEPHKTEPHKTEPHKTQPHKSGRSDAARRSPSQAHAAHLAHLAHLAHRAVTRRPSGPA